MSQNPPGALVLTLYLHALQWFVFPQVDWHRKGGTYWVRYIHIELLDQSPPPLASNGPIRVGDKVRVKSSVVTPKYKWGSVNHRNIGVVTSKSGVT